MSLDRQEDALKAIARHPDCHPEVYKIAADALHWTRSFNEIDRQRYSIQHKVFEVIEKHSERMGLFQDPIIELTCDVRADFIDACTLAFPSPSPAAGYFPDGEP